ncbi:type IV pilus modification PilV family protein [Syntrophorhabdus aromaticivorans]|jgi:prepilin-type N-terminal cleavage/methylation domain-containing protein|uniref:Prepilin-type N-terminal cleavage/methylation domain-containing protein n=1 Tax=Syntrophorhabdus aromaticivorans TaxID=328301 RepID=A0A971M724_9BACT|nr:prepilin-type N-terminal cleavage/methylation domain-containing protein [Syntrophorhabdus aromaticivorans]NLW36356.1 prepilin-type N-terminal cleavage/methylation domain-containing protein [Syntrophorhabdus aromaticivorans]
MITARKKDKGFTLVEVMVALLVLFISMMASLHALGLAVAHNIDNAMMEEAVRIEEETMNELRSTAFSSLNDGTTKANVTKMVGRISQNFAVMTTTQSLSLNGSRAIQVVVSWNRGGMTHHHSATSVISQGI